MAKYVGVQYRIYDDKMTLKEFEVQYALGTLSLKILLDVAQNRWTHPKMIRLLCTHSNLRVRHRAQNNHGIDPSWKMPRGAISDEYVHYPKEGLNARIYRF